MPKKLGVFAAVILLVMAAVACGGYSNPNQDAGGSAVATDNPIAAEIDQASQQGQDEDTLILRLGHQTPEETNYHRGSLRFKKLVEEKTNGAVRVDIYPFRELGTDRELLEAMQFGTLDLGMISGPPVSGFAPEAAVLDLPYLFKDWEHVNAFLESDVMDDYNALTEEANIKTIGTMARGYRHITTSAGPIETPNDLNGTTLRVIESSVYVESYETLGASPQSMNFGDAYTALEQGAIDGQENTTDIVYDENVYEVNNHVSKTGIQFAFGFLMASKDKFNSWPEDVQTAVLEASEEAMAETNEENEVHEKEYEELLKEEGMEIHQVNKEPFREKVESVYQNWREKHGDKMLNKIQSLAE
ncbi:TRAP transporter substrate-binding protein [Alteribacillus sp. JSM 102045]|uniref:TRAP transporter substrate-binding protein n=1 Tax=Alteribacillus sp. JSM 102045 TaxID=1562101 RepID=UPI0035BFD3EC